MEIASIILGVLSFIISFFSIRYIAIVIALTSVALGVIGIWKKKNKIFCIIGIAVSIIAIILVIILSIINGKISGDKITVKNEVEDKVQTISNNDVDVAKIQLDNIETSKADKLIIKITNNNENPVCIESVIAKFNDKNGNNIDNTSSMESNICIGPKGTTMIELNKSEKEYNNLNLSCTLTNEPSNAVYTGIELNARQDENEFIVATTQNKTGKDVKQCEVAAAYYKDNVIVGYSFSGTNETIKNGESCDIYLNYPTDSDSNVVQFDKCELYYISASVIQ